MSFLHLSLGKMPNISIKKVELAGVEPASKQAAYALSTCLVCSFFSITDRKQTSYLQLSFLNFDRPPKLRAVYPHIPVPLDQTPQGRAFERHLASLPCREVPRLTMIQSIRRPKRNCCCQLKG